MTEQEWFDRAERLGAMKLSFGPILQQLKAQVDGARHDVKAVQKLLDRLEVLQKRLARLQLVLERNWERRPLPVRVLRPDLP